MDVFHAYAYSTAGWFSLQSLPLIVSPKLIVTLLSAEAHTVTDLETYFSRSLGLTLVTLGVLALLLTGSVPLTSDRSDANSASPAQTPYAVPSLYVTTIFHSLSGFYAYMQYTQTGQTCFALSLAGCGSLAAMGLWCVLFGSEAGRISARTGADKRTSGFPFRNAEADKKKMGRRRL